MKIVYLKMQEIILIDYAIINTSKEGMGKTYFFIKGEG